MMNIKKHSFEIWYDKLPIRKKFFFVLYFCFPIGAIIVSLLGFIYWIFSLLIFVYVFIIMKIIDNLKCNKCGNNINEFQIWKEVFLKLPYCPDRCQHCGYDFTQPIKK